MSTQMDPQWKAYYAALEVARSSPVGALLDDLALSDLVKIEMLVPRDSKNEHAQKAMKYCAMVREAKGPIKANCWLRQAVVYFEDFMLWDDSILGRKARANQANRRKGKTKLNDAQKQQIVREYEAAFSPYGTTQRLAGKFDVSEDTISRVVSKKETKRD